MNLGKIDEAAAEFEEALRLAPDLSVARKGLEAARSRKKAATSG